MTIKEVLDRTTSFFRTKQIPSPRLDAELLISGSLGLERIQLYLKFDQPLKELELEKCREVVRRRTQGEPVAYILNQKYFYGFEFFVDARVLIPRPETELMVEMGIEELKKRTPIGSDHTWIPKILDLGCGSGCIGLTLLKKFELAEATLVDKESGPIEVTKMNAEKLTVLDRSQIIQKDVSQLQLEKQFHLILANPPYIDRNDPDIEVDVKKFEPDSALFAEAEGLSAFQTWVPAAAKHCLPEGLVIFEIGWKQGEQVSNIFQTCGLNEVRVHQDLSGRDRFVSGRK